MSKSAKLSKQIAKLSMDYTVQDTLNALTGMIINTVMSAMGYSPSHHRDKFIEYGDRISDVIMKISEEINEELDAAKPEDDITFNV